VNGDDREITFNEKINAAIGLLEVARNGLLGGDEYIGYKYSLLASFVLSEEVDDGVKKHIRNNGISGYRIVKLAKEVSEKI